MPKKIASPPMDAWGELDGLGNSYTVQPTAPVAAVVGVPASATKSRPPPPREGRGRGSKRSRRAPLAAEPPAAAASVVAVDRGYKGDAALDKMVAVASTKPGHRYKPRSWELCAHARGCKELKAVREEVSSLQEDVHAFTMVLTAMGGARAELKTLCGDGPRPRLVPEQAAIMDMHAASMAPVRGVGKDAARAQQSRAAIKIAKVAAAVQKQYVEKLMRLPRASVGAASGSAVAAPPAQGDAGADESYSAFMYTCQFDSTSQRLRAMTGSAPGRRESSAHHLSHVMMQHGGVTCRIFDRNGVETAFEDEPVLIPAVVIEGTCDANCLISMVLRGCPIPFENSARLDELRRRFDFMLFSVTTDRASTNRNALQYLWAVAALKDGPALSLHWEPCNAHGVALAKGRWLLARLTAAGLNSFSRWTRDSENFRLLRETLAKAVRKNELVIRRMARPDWHVEAANRIIFSLFAGDTDFLYKVNSKGNLIFSLLR